MTPKEPQPVFPAENLRADERIIYQIVEGLARAGAHRLASPLIRWVRFRRGDQRIEVEAGPKPDPARPAGPFKLQAGSLIADLLLYVPRNLISRMIDDATGGYGYSHVTIDSGEVDEATGKRVMFESMPGTTVHRSFQDEYGGRAFLRIPLAGLGIGPQEFYTCAESKLGEAYDDEDALTWGALHDPAKEICTGLVVHCLPEWMQADIAQAHRLGLLSRLAVSSHPHELWVSPNGFGEYFGAPPGRKVKTPDQRFTPSPQRSLKLRSLPRPGFRPVAVLFAVLGVIALGWALNRRRVFRVRS